jgi:uncharacterized protein (DUF427 family)
VSGDVTPGGDATSNLGRADRVRPSDGSEAKEERVSSDQVTRGRLKVEQGRKRVRALLAGQVVADTTRPMLVWEIPYYPAYYVPAGDVRAELIATGGSEHSPSRGDGQLHDVRVTGPLGERVAAEAAQTFPDSPVQQLRGLVRLRWDAMDEWLEEDEPVYTHPRDPHTRVDILNSSRHVRVSVNGVVVAESRQPRILFETGLPPRYYLPLSDVRVELLRPSPLVTHCPYKGAAGYWDVVIGDTVQEALVWTYRSPLPESQKVAGLVAFYDERVDISIDGVPQERPRTHFSR